MEVLTPILLESRLMPKEALCKMGMEATSQGDSNVLKSLIDWHRVAVTRVDEAESVSSLVTWTSPPEVTLMEPQLLEGQLKVVKANLPAWNNTNRLPYSGRGNGEEMVEKVVDILHMIGPTGLIDPAPTKKDLKPSKVLLVRHD
jgi:hypothetical protein